MFSKLTYTLLQMWTVNTKIVTNLDSQKVENKFVIKQINHFENTVKLSHVCTGQQKYQYLWK